MNDDPRKVVPTTGEGFTPANCQVLCKRVPPRGQVAKTGLVVPDGQGGVKRAGKQRGGGGQSCLELEVVKVGQGKDPISEEYPKDYLNPGDRVAIGTLTAFAIYLNGEEFIILDAGNILGTVTTSNDASE